MFVTGDTRPKARAAADRPRFDDIGAGMYEQLNTARAAHEQMVPL